MAAPRKIRLAPNLTMPLEAATETFGIFGVRGRGKTHPGAVLTEQMLAAGVPVVIIDPTGAHWGLRSSADGKRPGFPITIVGGEHGDVPLEKTAGKLLADLVVDKRVPLLIDTSDLSKTATRSFVTDFMERLFRRNRLPIHVIADECDIYVPQRTFAGIEELLGAMEDVVRRGRKNGIGITLISQRPAAVHTSVRSQVGTLILLGLTGSHDIKAVDDWVNVHADQETAKAVKSSLPGLPVGTAWVWSPEFMRLLRQIEVDRRTTFDSSATPKVGESLVPPQKWAAVDVDALTAEIAATVERAKENDPKALRAEVHRLRAEIERLKAEQPEPEIREVPVPVLDPELVASLSERLSEVTRETTSMREDLDRVHEIVEAGQQARAAIQGSAPPSAIRPSTKTRPALRRQSMPSAVGDAATDDSAAETLGKGDRTVLAVLAQSPEGLTYKALAILTGYSAKASTLGVILGRLRRLGYATDGWPVRLSEAGLAAAGGAAPMPRGPELLDYWRRHPRMGGGERKVLDVLIDAYPDALSHEEACERAGYSPAASTMGVILGKLRTLGLVEKGTRRAAPEFMDSIAS